MNSHARGTCFHVPGSPGDADTDPGRRENTLESCLVFGRRVFTCRRPSEAPRPPQEARGCPRRPPEGPRMPIHTCFHVPERHQDADHTCFYVSERPKESPGGRPIRVFTCFPGEWQRPKDGPGDRFIRVLPCFPCVCPASYVFLRVGGRGDVVWRRFTPFAGTVISCMLVVFWQDHT